jgi:hypothetical protein
LEAVTPHCFTSKTLKTYVIYYSETSVDFNGLHGARYEKTELFITTAVTASNLNNNDVLDRH